MRPAKNQIIFFGLAIHLLAAFFSVGYHQCDELFQTYEFAGYKLGLNAVADLPWEFHEQMRSGIQPLVVYGITKAFHFLSVTNPFTIACFIRVCMALLSFMAMVALLKILEEDIKDGKLKLWLWYAGLLFWCLPYLHARFSSENFSGTIFIYGLVILLKAVRSQHVFLPHLSAGILFGLAFLCRFQISFMIAGLLAWLLFTNKAYVWQVLVLLAGILIAAGIGLPCDKWLYGRWTLSSWNYLDLNLFHDKASVYGREPFYFYLEQAVLQLIPPFSLLIIFCIVIFWLKQKTHVITWITLPFILLHFFVAHKELRFLFPVLNFLPFMIIASLQTLGTTSNAFILFFKRTSFLKFAVVVNLGALLYFTCSPADSTSLSLKKIYDLVEGQRPVVYYNGNNPYNNLASLNYFRKPNVQMIDLESDSTDTKTGPTYYFSEKFDEGQTTVKNHKKFNRIYSNFPDWVAYLNVNGWLDRATTFSIYKIEKDTTK